MKTRFHDNCRECGAVMDRGGTDDDGWESCPNGCSSSSWLNGDAALDFFGAIGSGWISEALGKPRPVSTWWLSFCDADRPKGDQFLGVILVDAADLADALAQTHQAGCNPGGEVKAVALPPLDEVDDEDREDAAKTYALPRLTLLALSDIADPVRWTN